MTWSRELREYVNCQLARRAPALGDRRREIQELLARCPEEERAALGFLFATLPLPDLGDYPPAFFQEEARQALAARGDFPWCAALPEHLFLKHVLCPRVNNEELAACRGLFRQELEPRVRGLSLEEAILEVNRWCAQRATYRSTDGRTASPLQVYQCGWGRCGEESTFLTAALRSVGIAARQVYAPWWSHCDDNHAWVEAFDGSAWRYLGACEPEPTLDRGWFTHAAARAVLVHTRSFVQGSREEAAFLFPGADPLCWDLDQGVAWENLTSRYAETKTVSVQVTGRGGRPVPGAWVSFSVLNMAAPREAARLRADGAGRVSLPLGRGTVLVSAGDPKAPGSLGEGILAPEAGELTLELGRLLSPGEMAFLPPEDGGVAVPPLTGSQRRDRRRCLDRAAQLREERARRSPQPSPPAGERGRVWQSLSQKDRALPVDEALVEDGLRAFSWEGGLPSWAFEKGLLSPRVGLEALSPWRQLLEGRFSPEERGRFREDPSRLWGWVLSQAPLCREAYAALWGTPAGILQVGGATAAGQGLLLCAACRALGIPAYLEDGVPWYWREGAFHPLWGGEKSARLTLAAPRGRGAVSGQDYTLSRREAGGWRPLEGVDVLPGGEGEIPLAPGQYRLWTVTRLPNGSQLARWEEVSLAAGEARRTALVFREGEAAQMLERCPLPAFSLEAPDGGVLEGRELFFQSAFTLLLWLEVSREPTEHLLNELREQASQLQGTGCAVALVLEGWEERKDPTLARTLEAMPWARLWKGDFPEAVPALARRMYQDPDRLPLALLVNRRGEGLFACCGYNVGTGALLLRLLAAAGEG